MAKVNSVWLIEQQDGSFLDRVYLRHGDATKRANGLQKMSKEFGSGNDYQAIEFVRRTPRTES